MNKMIVYSIAQTTNELQSKVDAYLENTSYNKLINLKKDDMYDQMYSDICKITNTYFPTIDITNSVELSIRHDRLANIIEVTGYVKVDYDKFITIEKTYEGEKNIV